VDHEHASGISVGVVAAVLVEMVDRQQTSLPVVGDKQNILETNRQWQKQVTPGTS